jgi:branched-chain amino acid transport system substrate-binding protein
MFLVARHTRLAGAGLLSMALFATACTSSTPAAPTAAPAAGGAEVSVALLVPTSSGNSTFASQMENSARLAVKDYNASAGGCRISLKVYDTKGVADETTTVTQRALTVDGAKVVVGAYSGAEALAVKQLTEREKVVYMSSSTISPAVTENAKYTFRVAATQDDYPTAMAQLVKKIGASKPAMIHDDGPIGATAWQPTVDALKAAGLTVSGTAVSFPLNSPDLSAPIQQLSGQHPDAVIHLGSSGADAGLLAKTLLEQGLKTPLIGYSSVVSPDSIKIAGAAADSLGLYAFYNRSTSKPEYQKFAEKYIAEYGGDGNVGENANQTYDALNVLGAALNANKCATDGDSLAGALRALPPQDVSSGGPADKLSFAKSQNGFSASGLVPYKYAAGKLEEVK